jgi:anti-sigma28 factor (negative regulator of flagellin synthesis)
MDEFTVPENDVLDILKEVGLAKRLATMDLINKRFGERKKVNELKRKIRNGEIVVPTNKRKG